MTSWDEATARSLVSQHREIEGGLLPALHALVDHFGYVDDRSVPALAEAFGLSRADVFGVISFYRDFRRAPPGRHVVRLCRAEACQAVGCERVRLELERLLGAAMDTTSADGNVTLETVYCLGNCALGPSALVDGVLIGRATAALIGARVAP